MSKDDYIKMISAKSDCYGDKLLELMAKYNKSNLRDITLDEAREFWEELKDKENDNENRYKWNRVVY